MGSIQNEPKTGYFKGLRLKMSLDGNYNAVLRGAERLITITWSKKHQRYFINFRDPLVEHEVLFDPTIQNYLNQILANLKEYKKEVSRLESLKTVLEALMRN